MENRGSLTWWQTPLSGRGYDDFLITEGNWESSVFQFGINCRRVETDAREIWSCVVKQAISVRVILDEFTEVTKTWKLPEGTFEGPFFRVVGSAEADEYRSWLQTTGAVRNKGDVHEYFVSSLQNELHIFSLEEPSFEKRVR